MNYNEMHLPSDHSNDRASRYPSPISPMDSLIASCPSFDMTHTPSLQDSPGLPSYRVQFGQEISLLDDGDRNSAGFSSSIGESYSIAAHDSSASFSMSLFDGNVFSEDTYSGPFGPLLVPNASNDMSSWTPRSVTSRDAAQTSLCLSPYAVNSNNSYIMHQRESTGECLGRSRFGHIQGDSTASSETDSMPRTPETIAPSATFSSFPCLMEHNSLPGRGPAWSFNDPGSAGSSFLEDDHTDSVWKMPRLKSETHNNIRPVELRQVNNNRRSQVTKRKRLNTTRTQPDRAARLDAALSSMTYGIQLEHISKPTSRCDECNQNFQRPEHLTRHKKSASHTRATPFECELERCLDKKTGRRKCFNRQDNKTAHIINTHLKKAAKGRRDRVSRDEALRLGWNKYLMALEKDKGKQEPVMERPGRPSGATSNSSNTSSSARITKKTTLRQQAKALR